MIVADASWVIALRDPGDPHHEAARAANGATLDEPVVIHPVTLAECLVGPASAGRLDDAHDAASASFELAEVDRHAPARWADLRASTGLRLPDAIVLDTALVHAARAILTFDDRVASAAKRRSIGTPATDTAD